jgi:acyl carrier protein
LTTTDVVRRLLLDNVRYESPADLEADDFPLIENHVIDSLEVMRLIELIEAEFRVRVDDEDVVPGNFCTINAIARFVDSKRAASTVSR